MNLDEKQLLKLELDKKDNLLVEDCAAIRRFYRTAKQPPAR